MSGRTDVRPAPLPGLANGGNSSTGNGFEDTMGAALGYTHTFGPTAVNELRVGFNYAHIQRGVPVGGNVLPPSELRVPGVPNNPGTNGITLFSPTGYRRIGDPGQHDGGGAHRPFGRTRRDNSDRHGGSPLHIA